MYCPKCGAEQPSDQVVVCFKCGHRFRDGPGGQLAPERVGVAQFTCSSCGAPIKPELGDAVITCEYCGTSIYLGSNGWNDIPTHTMLPLNLPLQDDVLRRLRDALDKGIFHRNLQESSELQGISLAMVPYWLVNAQTTTSITTESLALEAVKLGVRGEGDIDTTRSDQFENSYQIPVVAVKSIPEFQPKDCSLFKLSSRVLFDASQVKDVKVLRGDVDQGAARSVAKDMAEKLESDAGHSNYHMIQNLTTDVKISEWELELVHVPVWSVTYDRNGNKMVFVVDGNSGGFISTSGL